MFDGAKITHQNEFLVRKAIIEHLSDNESKVRKESISLYELKLLAVSETNTIQNQQANVLVYNPNEIINIFADSLARKSNGVITVRGIYHPKGSVSYSGYYYDSLRDEFSSYELSLKVPSLLRENLDDGNLVELRGTIERKVNNYCSVQLTLNVTGAAVVKEQTVSEDELKRIEVRKKKAASGFKNVDIILENAMFADRRPSVGLIFADSSITDSDFNAGKDAAAVHVDFLEYRVSFARPAEFVSVLRRADVAGHDVVCVVRGGGSGLEALENLDVLECVAGMNTAVVTAVGHVEDDVFIENVADKKIGTPSLLGTYFKDIVENVAKKKADSTAALTKKIEGQFKEQIETSKKQNAELQKKFEELTKASADAAKKHDDQVKAAQAQNKTLQDKITEMGKSAEATQKQNKEQNDKLQKQLKEITESNRKQSEELTKKIGQMQTSITALTGENAKVNRELSAANTRNSQLQAELAASKGKGGKNTAIAVLAILVIFLFVALLLK